MFTGVVVSALLVGGAMLAPAAPWPQAWGEPALTAYLFLVTAGGYAAAAVRRWGWAGLATLAGAAAWAIAAYGDQGYTRIATLAIAPLAFSIAALEWRRRRGDAVEADWPKDSFAALPAAAAAAAFLLVAPLWLANLHGAELAVAAFATMLLTGLTALAVRRGLAPAPTLLLGFAAAASMTSAWLLTPLRATEMELWAGPVALAAAAAGTWSALPGRSRPERLYAGAGALATLLIALVVKGPWTSASPWIGPAEASALLGVGAWMIARRARTARDLPLAIWIGAAVVAIVATLKGLNPPGLLP